jgi:hypothetical protein
MLGMSAQPLSTLKDGQWSELKLTWDGPETGNSIGCPIGNGHIGARVKNGVDSETLALNHKWFCAGGPGLDPENPQRKAALEETRRLLASGDIPGAEMAARGMYGRDDVGSLLPLGRLTLSFDRPDPVAGFSRILDLDRAVNSAAYTIGEVTYTREAFASFPDDVIVVRVGSSAKGGISFTAKLSYPTQMEGHGASLTSEAGNVLVMKGKAPANGGWDEKKGMTFEARVKIIADGGTVMPGVNLIDASQDYALSLTHPGGNHGGNRAIGFAESHGHFRVGHGHRPVPVVGKSDGTAAFWLYHPFWQRADRRRHSQCHRGLCPRFFHRQLVRVHRPDQRDSAQRLRGFPG